MKQHRFREQPADNASKGHVKVFNTVKEVFPFHEVYQEYPYSKILEKRYKTMHVKEEHQDSALLKEASRLHADIYDPNLLAIIEIQGEQHYHPVRWSKDETEEEARSRYESQVRIDRIKKRIAVESGLSFIEVKYDEIKDFDADKLFSKLEIL